MPYLIFTYSSKPGVPFEAFQRFLEEVDQPVTLGLPSTVSSAIYRLAPPDSGDTPFTCVEVLEITSFAAWEEDSQRPEVKKVVDQWADYGDVDNIKAYQAECIFKGKA